MSHSTLIDLFEAIEMIAKKMLRSPDIPLNYIYVSIALVFAIASTIILPLENQYIYLLTLVFGFIGSTALSTYLSIIVYLYDRHLELSKYYYSSIRDLLSRLKYGSDLGDFDKKVEELLLTKKLDIEYSPVTLVPIYTALLLLPDKIYMLSLVIVYAILCSIVMYRLIELYNEHIEFEEVIEEKIKEILAIKGERRKYNTIKYGGIEIVVSTVTLTTLLPYYIYMFMKRYEKHLADHRANYELFKKKIVKTIGIPH